MCWWKYRPADGPRSGRCVINSRAGIDATTIRMIQRMLAAGMMRHSEIAREAGVSPHIVDAVAAGKRVAISTERPLLNDGEQFLPEPIRCSGCRARIEVVPCRACGARQGVDTGGLWRKGLVSELAAVPGPHRSGVHAGQQVERFPRSR